MNGRKFALPESVAHFISDARVRSAVTLLLDSKQQPDGLEWTEVPDYYRAHLAAHQTKAEWALALEQLWSELWPDHLSGWQPLLPDRQAREEDLTIDLDYLFDEGNFKRAFQRGQFVLYTAVTLSIEEGCWVSGALWDQKGDPLFVGPTQEVPFDDDWLVSDPLPFGPDGALNVEPLYSAASRIAAAAEVGVAQAGVSGA